MSRHTSKRAGKARDWSALLGAVREEDAEARAVFPHGKWRDTKWGEDYVHAMQRALEGRDPTYLLKMLDSGVPLSDRLLPALAEVIRDLRTGRYDGRPAKMTALQDELVREAHEDLRQDGMRVGKAHEFLADSHRETVVNIKRSLKRTKPPA